MTFSIKPVIIMFTLLLSILLTGSAHASICCQLTECGGLAGTTCYQTQEIVGCATLQGYVQCAGTCQDGRRCSTTFQLPTVSFWLFAALTVALLVSGSMVILRSGSHRA